MCVSIASLSVSGNMGQGDAGGARGISTVQFIGDRAAAMVITDVTDLPAQVRLPDSHSGTGTERDLATAVLHSQDESCTDNQVSFVGPSCRGGVGLQPDCNSGSCRSSTLGLPQPYAALPDTITTTDAADAVAAATAAEATAAAVDASDEHVALCSRVGPCHSLAPSVRLASAPVDDVRNTSCSALPLPSPCPVLASSPATSVLPLDDPLQSTTLSSGGPPEVLRVIPSPDSEALGPALPPYTRWQSPMDTVGAVKGPACAYTPFLRHHVTHVKLQGVEPSMIQPGYEERLRNLIHMRTGRLLSHVYVRSGCIELVLDCEEWGSGVLTRGSPCSAWSPRDSHGDGMSAEDADVGVYGERASTAGSGCGVGSAEAAAGGSSALPRTGRDLSGMTSDSSSDGMEARNGQSVWVQPSVCGSSAGGAAGHQPRCTGEAGRLGGPEPQGSGGGVRTQPRTLRVPHALVGHQLAVTTCTSPAGEGPFADCAARSEFESRRRPGSVRANGHGHATGDIGVNAPLDSLESSAGGVGTWEFVRALQLQPQPLGSSNLGAVCADVGNDAAASSSGVGSPSRVNTAVLMSPLLMDGPAAAVATAAAGSALTRALRNDGGGNCSFETGNYVLHANSEITATVGYSTTDTTAAAAAAVAAAIAMEPRILFMEGQATTRPLCDSAARRALGQACIASLEPRVLLAAEPSPPTSPMPVLSGSTATATSTSTGNALTGNAAVSTGLAPNLSASFGSGALQGQRGQVAATVSAAVEQAEVADPTLALTLKAVVRCDSHLLCGSSLELLVRSEGRYLSAVVSTSGPTPPTAGDDAAAGGDVGSRLSYNIVLPQSPPLRPGIVLLDLRVHDMPVHAAPIVVVHNAAMASELRRALATAQLSEDDRDSLLMDLGTWVFHAAGARKARSAHPHHHGSGGACPGPPGQAPPQHLGPSAITGTDALEGSAARLFEEGRADRLGMLGIHLLKYALAAGWCCTAATLATDLAAMGVKRYAPELALSVAAVADITAARTGNADMDKTGSRMPGGAEMAAAAPPEAVPSVPTSMTPTALTTEVRQPQAAFARTVATVRLTYEVKAAAVPVLKSWNQVPFFGSLFGARAAAGQLPGLATRPGANDLSRASPEKGGLARRRPLHSAGVRSPSTTTTTDMHGDLPPAAEAVPGGGSCGSRSGSAIGQEAACVSACAADAAGARALTALGALLVECGFGQLSPLEEATYQTYAAPRIAAQGYVITVLDLVALATLVTKCVRKSSDSGSWVTLLAYWVSVVELLMHAGGAFISLQPMDWARVHQVCKVVRYISYMATKILCALGVVDLPPGIESYVMGLTIFIQEGVVHPASNLLSLRLLAVLTMIRAIANTMIISAVHQKVKGERLGRGSAVVWAGAISVIELLTSMSLHVYFRVSYSRWSKNNNRRKMSVRQMLGGG
ncbi:hypothetical protein VaNZ11_010479 [Volvox africanus]|uniref:Uncharacterized protein n=1 Tax=Volvox africanus TaxID=51714 RepID=A0ABQ5SB03_9CHLO|nr:hypothetical protein VaNZ11_010479 [Volvox africanus]